MPNKPIIVNDGYHEAMLCRNCGFCCTLSPKLNDFDIERIKKIGYLDEFFVKRNIKDEKYLKQKDGRCVFLRIEGENISCEIYEHRPTACRIYPSYDHKIKECPNKGKSWKSSKNGLHLKPIYAFK